MKHLIDSVLHEILSVKNLVHAISGSTASVVAISTFYPLDSARTRLQAGDLKSKNNFSLQLIREIFEKEGIYGIYRGLSSIITALGFSNFVYFYAYNCIKVCQKNRTATMDLLTAYTAGAINVLLSTPLWVVNTRLKLQSNSNRYTGIIDCASKIITAEGIKALWSGTTVSLLLASNPAIQWMFYESLKRYVARIFHNDELSSFTIFILSAISKFLATFLTYPLQILQTRCRAKNSNPSAILKAIIKEKNFQGLFLGFEAKLTQTVLTAAFMLVVYEKIVANILTLMKSY
ncbi:DgyrCDS2108 [Dimorphilus gyrociliatus]|uniref:DgyrCDS2108 n=1 Tax=Dimorphilus gyrociliatus TaxID=2664684 RepID=A0A7I8VCC9_9ANNE|nr:DgyrCDS2108 [Dimorphilus gyrociliatus]